MGSISRRQRGLVWLAPLAGCGFLLAASVGSAAVTDGSQIAVDIDEVVAESVIGPAAQRCGDADFVRRIHLDLAGAVPAVETVREFLADSASDKRRRLVENLLASPAFARRMAYAFDAMLLERDSPPGGLRDAWQAWLREQIAADRPLDQLCAEVVAATGGDPAANPAAAFLLARGGEPIKMTRAIGRTLFGRELQCAQCHDHPLDGDILQAEFHGLHAFVNRTSLFKAGKVQQLSEAASGEVDYRSVFTEASAAAVWPQLPDGPPLIDEPVPEPSDGYAVTPSKKSRGVPAYSRRAALAKQLATSDAFRRNLVNRLWAFFFGRGLIHPLDGVGPANPASHPELLERLGDRLATGGFRLRPIVRGIVLSETYQRAVDPPAAVEIEPAEVEAQLGRVRRRREQVAARLERLERAAAAAESRFRAAFAAERAIAGKLRPLYASRNEARKVFDAADKAAAAAAASAEKAARVAAAVAAAAAEAKRAAMLLAGDAALADLAASLEHDRSKRQQAGAAAEEQRKKTAEARRNAEENLRAARAAVSGEAARRSPATLADLSREATEATRQLVVCQQQLARLDWRRQLAQDLIEHTGDAAPDATAAATRWQSIQQRWTENLQVARLRPLAADQFLLAVLEATGGLARLRVEATAAIEKKPPESVTKAAAADRQAARQRAIEQAFQQRLDGLLTPFVATFSDPFLEGFQASVNQALLVANGPQISGELPARKDSLVGRLASEDNLQTVAEEVCLALLSRPARPAERKEWAAHLAAGADDRPRAIGELVWAVLASNEFRFNH